MLGLVTFLTDYGTDDLFVGLCVAAMAETAPGVRVIHLSHAVPAGDVAHGALLLADAVGYLPAAVHLGVVDPGVGTSRRGVVVATAESLLVGPDNGLLWAAAEALGGPIGGWALDRPRAGAPRSAPTGRTFDGRDLFAPVAARLAAGDPPEAFGSPIDHGALVRLELPAPRIDGDRVAAQVVHVDRYGNVQLSARPGDVPWHWPPAAVTVSTPAQGQHRVAGASAFGDVPRGELLCYADAFARLALAVNGGSAASRLGLRRGDTVELAPAV